MNAIALYSVWTRAVTRHWQKHLVLMLAREVVSNLATPALVADTKGMLVFFNEAAERL